MIKSIDQTLAELEKQFQDDEQTKEKPRTPRVCDTTILKTRKDCNRPAVARLRCFCRNGHIKTANFCVEHLRDLMNDKTACGGGCKEITRPLANQPLANQE